MFGTEAFLLYVRILIISYVNFFFFILSFIHRTGEIIASYLNERLSVIHSVSTVLFSCKPSISSTFPPQAIIISD